MLFRSSEVICENSGCSLSRDSEVWLNHMLKFKELDSKVLIEHARERALNFSWKKTANDLIQLYEVKVVA